MQHDAMTALRTKTDRTHTGNPPANPGTTAPDWYATAGVVVDVIHLLPPERFVLDRFRMVARLPEAPLAVGRGLFTQGLRE